MKMQWDMKPCYLYNENTNTWKDGRDTETGPCASYLQFFNSCQVSIQESFLKSSDGVSLIFHLFNLISRTIAENDIKITFSNLWINMTWWLTYAIRLNKSSVNYPLRAEE